MDLKAQRRAVLLIAKEPVFRFELEPVGLAGGGESYSIACLIRGGADLKKSIAEPACSADVSKRLAQV
jgi:hypothetical protein